MYHQITRNKRNSIVVVALFLLVWLAAGFVIGELSGGTGYAIAGAIVLGVLGVLAALYSYYFGAATVLSAVGAKEADPRPYVQLYNIVQTLSIGDGLPVPKVSIIASVFWNGALRFRTRDARALLVVFAIGAIFTLIAFLVGPLMQLALSRQRESLADVSGVELTRNP